MSASINSLLSRNFHEVFGERDPAPRRRVIDSIFEQDCVFADPRGRHVRRDAIDQGVEALQRDLPDYRFIQLGDPDQLQDAGRLAWAYGPTHEPRRITGLDVVVASGGRIAALYTFLNSSGA